jgi:hypothetical protein
MIELRKVLPGARLRPSGLGALRPEVDDQGDAYVSWSLMRCSSQSLFVRIKAWRRLVPCPCRVNTIQCPGGRLDGHWMAVDKAPPRLALASWDLTHLDAEREEILLVTSISP